MACWRDKDNITRVVLPLWYFSFGARVDANYQALREGNFTNIEFSWMPTPTQPNNQANAVAARIYQFMQTKAGRVSRVWLTIPQTFGKSDEKLLNRGNLEQAVAALQHLSIPVGIQASKELWSTMFGTDYSSPQLDRVPVMYINTKAGRNFDDWPSLKFGGWTTPTGKIFAQSVCTTLMFRALLS
jgi:hypothetical protein